MKATPVKGTNDYLPREVRIRDYLTRVILETYQAGGFERITTPILEDMENLNKSDGGENLGLIFKILKRGDKLRKALDEKQYEDLSDVGLRYDLTLPLSRYYANNRSKLVLPFKCIQMDRVYRAERPQKGRLREFMQCDIDIIGSSSPDSEVELIHTTTKALMALGLRDFTVKVNDRRILHGILSGAGFLEDEQDSVCIVFDKLDKIGADGVQEELLEKGFDKEPVANLMKLLEKEEITLDTVEEICSKNPGIENLRYIIDSVNAISQGAYQVVYDMSLVRGQGYYTGTVFEVEAEGFRGAIAGGGRYDNLIGKFTKESIPAVGFSIGFERLFGILMEQDFKIPQQRKKVALLYGNGEFQNALAKAEEFRSEYDVALFEKPKKVGKYLDRLKEQDYAYFYIMNQSEELNALD